MVTVTMTQFNQQVSSITRRVVEQGETVRVTNRGRVVLRLVPEPAQSGDSLAVLISAGLGAAPTKKHARIGQRAPVPLSRDLDEILRDVNADAEF